MVTEPHYNKWQFASAGLELVGKMVVLMALGYGVDRWLGIWPWATMAGALIGIVGGLVKLVWDSMRAFPKSQSKQDK